MNRLSLCWSLFRIPRTIFPTRTVSILHQRFLRSHLTVTYLTSLGSLFSSRSPQQVYTFCSEERFDNPACTALPMLRLHTKNASSSLQHVKRTSLNFMAQEYTGIFSEPFRPLLSPEARPASISSLQLHPRLFLPVKR